MVKNNKIKLSFKKGKLQAFGHNAKTVQSAIML